MNFFNDENLDGFFGGPLAFDPLVSDEETLSAEEVCHVEWDGEIHRCVDCGQAFYSEAEVKGTVAEIADAVETELARIDRFLAELNTLDDAIVILG